MKQEIKPATGRLGVLVVGVGGAVATTMIVGTLASRKGLAKPIGSITQLATMRMENNEEKLIKDIVPLTNLEDIVFGGWDIFPDNAYEAAMYAEVLKEKDLNGVKEELEAIKPMPAAFDHNWAKRLNGTHVKKAATRWEMVEQLRQDIRDFKAANNCERVVVLWAASTEIKPATGRLGVLVVGVGGAVATTMIVGTLASRKGLAKPIGSITQLATMRMENNEEKLIKDIVPLTNLEDIVFGGWDIFPDNAYEAAMYAEVLKEKDLNGVKEELEAIKPMPAAFDHNWAKRLNGTHVKKAATRWEMVEQLRQDIRDFKAANNCERVVVLWAASTEIYIPLSDEHMSLAALEKAMKENNTDVISPSMCYAYAAIAEDAPFVMGAPNLCVDTPAMWEFSKQKNVPISGKDFKSGQTLMKTVLAPMFKTRMLGVNGWFSTNILGNRDGEVLDDPDNFKTKEVSKLSVIDTIFEPEKYPDLYGDVYHKVRINYYPPRKDNKEAWDNIDIFGWMGYPMEIKVNFLCRDSILAAPIALDLVLFSDLAMRAGMCGIQTWLSFFCKSPMHDFEHQPEHDLFTQWRMVKQTLRNMIGEKEPDYLA